ncbi:hypothetical protein KBA73_04925 [Patescibacteria group bacterium]|nr:hypothetical protein [Patescibacteria group bacterium]
MHEVHESFVETPGDKAAGFCAQLIGPYTPEAFRKNALTRLVDWKLLSPDVLQSKATASNEAFKDQVRIARRRAEAEPADFLEAFAKAPWDYDEAPEGKLTAEECAESDVYISELKELLSEPVDVYLSKPSGADFIVVLERADGRRQVLRKVESDRPIEAIQEDARNAPALFPHFEAIRYSNGMTGLLIDFIDGHPPHTPEEKQQCAQQAEDWLKVDYPTFDFNLTNFLMDAEGKPFYIDRDAMQAIACSGYTEEVTPERRLAFEAAKKQLQ